MRSDALKKAQLKYDRGNTTSITLKLNNKTDGDIIEFLSQVDNRQGTIKEIIRKYILDPS